MEGPLRGSVRWAVAPFVPREPFRLYAGIDTEPIAVTASQLLRAGKRGGDVEQTYLVPGKVRPVLIVSDAPSERFEEVLALRLYRLEKLASDAERQLVRDQGDPLLFHLPIERFELPSESAAMISTLIRIHIQAIDPGPPAGVLNDNEWRVVSERLVRHLRFDLRMLFEEFVNASLRPR